MFCSGAVELLAARALALLRSLTDFETATFLDQCCGDPVMHAAMRAVACRATFLAGARVCLTLRPSCPCYNATPKSTCQQLGSL
jgi:hypothetical protein